MYSFNLFNERDRERARCRTKVGESREKASRRERYTRTRRGREQEGTGKGERRKQRIDQSNREDSISVPLSSTFSVSVYSEFFRANEFLKTNVGSQGAAHVRTYRRRSRITNHHRAPPLGVASTNARSVRHGCPAAISRISNSFGQFLNDT